MLEYGIKTITTNPTLITKTNEIIKLVDSRSKETRAFVLPSSFAPLVKRLEKEIESKKWVEEKKKLLKNNESQSENLDDIMQIGLKSLNEYLSEF